MFLGVFSFSFNFIFLFFKLFSALFRIVLFYFFFLIILLKILFVFIKIYILFFYIFFAFYNWLFIYNYYINFVWSVDIYNLHKDFYYLSEKIWVLLLIIDIQFHLPTFYYIFHYHFYKNTYILSKRGNCIRYTNAIFFIKKVNQNLIHIYIIILHILKDVLCTSLFMNKYLSKIRQYE